MGGCGTKQTAVLQPQALTDGKTADAPPAPVLTEASAEERALTQLKIIFDGIDKNRDCSVSKEELAAALDKDESLGALIKEAGLNQNYRVLEQLDTDKDGRMTWDEFHANLKTAAKEEVHATGQVAAVELPADEKALKQLKKLFELLDANADAAVSMEELAVALDKDESLGALIKESGFNQNYKVLEQLVTTKDGRVTWHEFLAYLKLAALAAVELPADEKTLKQLKKLFALLDANADSTVSKEELAAGLSKDESIGNLVKEAGFNPNFCFLQQFDTNHDGRIAWEEFEAHLRSAAKEEVKEQAAVAATVVLQEQQKDVGADEANEEVAGVVAPGSMWCCSSSA